jgi:hypothetical protein
MAVIIPQEPTPGSNPPKILQQVMGQKDLKGSLMARQPDISEAPQAPVEAATSPETQEDPLSSKYAEFARREKALLAKAQALKAKEDAIKAKEAEHSSGFVDKRSFKDRLQRDAYEAFQDLGVSYDEIAQAILSQPKDDYAYRSLQSKLSELEQKQQETQSKFEERQNQALEQALNQIRFDVKALITRDPSYEMIREGQQEEAVTELIKETFDQQGIVLGVEEAAAQVENYLIEEAMRWAKMKKIQEKLMPAPSLEAAQKPQLANARAQENSPVATAKTLTNAQAATSSKPKLTERERRERAMLAFKGMLNA